MFSSPASRSARHFHAVVLLSVALVQSCSDDDPSDQRNLPLPLPQESCFKHLSNGYTDKISYFPGEKMKLFLSASVSTNACRLTIYTVNGDSVFSVPTAMVIQTAVADEPSANGFGYTPTTEFTLPVETPSGAYMIEKQIPFIVKTRNPVDLMVVYNSNTANAYAESGGKSLYSRQDRPYQVSFHRPIPLERFSEYCLKWFTTQHEFTIGYIADSDLDDYSNITNSKILTIVGHNEYWTRQGRLNFDRFVDSGGHALILSGNNMWWQVRYSDDGSKLICYKSAVNDPIGDPLLKTITWDLPGLQYPILSSIGADSNHGGYGLQQDNGWNGYKIVRPNSPLLEGLDLSKNDILPLPTAEYDGVPLKGFDENGDPIVDAEALGFEKVHLIGYDRGYRGGETFGTFVVIHRTPASGIIIHTGSTDWCSINGMGGQGQAAIKRITYNAIKRLLTTQPVFGI